MVNKVNRLMAALFFTLLLCQFSIAQNEYAVVNFDVFIAGEILKTLDPYEPSGTREKEKFMEVEKYMDAIADNVVWEAIVPELNSAGLTTLPKDALLNYTKTLYSANSDYPSALIPKGSIKNAKKNGFEGEHFVSIVMRFNNSMDLAGVGKLGGSIKPNLEVVVTTFDGSGKKVAKETAKKKCETKIKRKDFVGGFDKSEEVHMEELVDKLMTETPELFDMIAEKISKAL
ncbi:MAG: hypothetical protein KTR24_14005 [Saprospiraceae bacterium]|nr:hypothetical protein [Saprospiraceae bacterium]